LVNNDRLVTLSWLKIQSTLFGNIKDSSGDEMNMHIPRSLQTAVELEQICLVPKNIISPGTSTPCIEITQDTLLGAYLLTQKDIKLRRDQMNNYMMFTKKYDGILPEPESYNGNVPYWSGKQLYSLILPDITINQIKTIEIIRGNITKGYLNGDSLGSGSAGLIKQIYNAYGMDTCNDFLNDTQKLITRWMVDNSFTIGFGDSTVNKEQRKRIKEITNKYLEESFDLIKQAQHGVFANDLDDAYKGSNLEFQLMKILSNLSEKVKEDILQNIDKNNNFYQAGDKGSGAKGKTTNIQQIMGCVGQQDIWGSRIEEGFTQRTLPHFTRNDVGPDAKGFCRNSFIEGLSPSEMFFHAMGGRTGTIDTAIKSVTGDTPIIIIEEGVLKHVNIGDWIDMLLKDSKEIQSDISDGEHREMLKINHDTYIPTTSLDGKIEWGQITHITRHNPSAIMYEIKTTGGRHVTVTDSHSLLIWNEETEQLERKSASNVFIGVCVPVTRRLCSMDGIEVPLCNFKEPFKTIKERDLGILNANMHGYYVEIDKINNLKLNPTHPGFDEHNDIVLECIIEINKVDITKYSKVYDLTVPSTLNFGLANGLHVVDTADSGYLSRKFIKATEDLIVNYDFTVRNASNHIVQFGYGDDNFDPIKLEKVTRIELIEFDNKKMEEVYKHDSLDDPFYFENFMTKEAMEKMMDDPNYKNILNDEYEEILQYQKDLRYKYFNNTEAIGDINTYIPINLYRVIPSQLIKFNVQSFDLSDLTPQYVIDTYNEALKNIIKYLPEKEGNWKLFKIIFKSFLSTKKVIKEYRMNKGVYDSIILIIKEKMMGALINPGELVGIIGAQTLGEISTQLTLNSVTYETDIIVRDSNKRIEKIQIGEFIEREIKRSQKIDYMQDKDTTYAECLDYFEIPSCNEEGEVLWTRIEAVTKHPVINKDGSNTMLKVTTEDEREVIATKAKSFLKLINGKIVGCNGEDLKVGDYLPVSTKQIDFEETYTLDMRTILPMNEYVYGSELEKAKAVMHEYHWWVKHANKTFTLPHKRSDTVVQLISDRVRKGRKTKSTIKNGNVYMLLSNNCDYEIPEIVELDYNFGYLIGAYCAEGCMSLHQISLSNNDSAYFGPIEELCKKWNITTKIYRNENKEKDGWTSQDIRIYSTLLCRILDNLCGKLSHNKFISDKIIFSNKTCLRGFLDAYIGGDGCINAHSKNIMIGSTSKLMLIDVQQILNIFGVYSRIYKPPKQESNNRGSQDIKQMYHLYVDGKEAFKLAGLLEMKIEYKKEAVIAILKHNHNFEYAKKYEKILNEVDGEIIYEDRNGRYTDILFDKIKSIEEVSNTTNYAYDLTVEKTRNFNLYNVLCVRDTFHLAGVGAGSLVITQGIPRLRELINVSKNPKEKNMIIYMKDEYSTNKDNARKVQSRFGYTQLKDILAKSEILYDNKYGNTDSNEDREFIKSYKEFTELFEIDNIDESCLSPWILRLTFDKEGLMNRKITVIEIQETIKENFHNDQEIDCIYSDDSVNDVIMRIRIKQDSKGSFLDFMKDFEKQLISLPLRGIMNIKQVELTETNILKYNYDGSIQPSKEWILKTSGSNLVDILSDDAVDNTRTITNDIIEFHEIFGIEATRELLYRELFKVYAEKNPNPRHIQMLSDIMTYRGKLMQIDRHGLNKNSEIGPIAKASFEEVMNIFTKAALFAEKDNMKGVSANILAGQFCKSGTNSFEILIDEDKLLEKIDIPDYMDNQDLDVNEKDIDKVFSSVYNSYEQTQDVEDKDFTFGFGIEQTKEYELGDLNTSNIIISSKEKESSENKFDDIDINTEIKYNNNDKLDINFEKINIEEPHYEEEPVKIVEDKPKKIKIKKEKKVKIVKKKSDIENDK